MQFHVNYDPKTQLNLITYKGTIDSVGSKSDTVANCWVSRFRGLYYLSEPVTDTSYLVYAVKINNQEIKGLLDGFWQMAYLKEEIDKGNYKVLVKSNDTAKHHLHLSFDKHLLKDFFTSVVDSSSSLKFIQLKANIKEVNSSDTFFVAKASIQKDELVRTIYPNPAFNNCSIVFYNRGKYKIDIFDLNRHLVKTTNTSEEQINIILTEFNPGTYITVVTNLETGLISTSKLMVQR